VGDNGYHRHRVEHASLLPPDLLARMAERRIVAVVQPQFVRSDAWTPERLGAERARHAYPFRSMLRAGVPLALSSDCPVESLDAFACLDAAVNRHPWSPDETLTPEEAIRAYTSGGAYAAHADDRVGSLEVGKLADFVILSDDPRRRGGRGIGALAAEQVTWAACRFPRRTATPPDPADAAVPAGADVPRIGCGGDRRGRGLRQARRLCSGPERAADPDRPDASGRARRSAAAGTADVSRKPGTTR
jgi:hypothetical protein